MYLAPPHRHLVVRPHGWLSLVDGRPIRHVLSSANPLFESAAAHYGDRCIAVVLSGGGMDATDGVQSIKQAGGIVIVQDEATSKFFGMPGAAIASGVVDYILPLDDIGLALLSLGLTGTYGAKRNPG